MRLCKRCGHPEFLPRLVGSTMDVPTHFNGDMGTFCGECLFGPYNEPPILAWMFAPDYEHTFVPWEPEEDVCPSCGVKH